MTSSDSGEVITGSNIQFVTDRLAQSLVNNLTLVELAHTELVNDPAIGWNDGTHLDRDQTWYYGGSLGGIQGASFTAVSPDVTRSVLAAPGAGWSTITSAPSTTATSRPWSTSSTRIRSPNRCSSPCFRPSSTG